MIASLRGDVLLKNPDGRIVMDVSGVGYEVFVPVNQLAGIEAQTFLSLWIYSHVREDTFCLYGFLDEKERQVFVTLLSINGVGPKLAHLILSSCASSDLIRWIESEDIHALCQLPKIGKKTAHQIVLSLKGSFKESLSPKTPASNVMKEISSALIRLGFRSSEVKQVLDRMDQQQNVPDGVRHALSVLQNL